ncbi:MULTISPECIES: peptidylprolyl isomerase [unclassified Ruegeria]|uniref:peptidylprolyl isomerase n=1 Tax=unclassified Ruegeria TaxID=2625375 RepID=UPI0014890883|nr:MULTISPECIES: peptidylprolyl isomerase [unclassified Ruegeria]NOD75525.1 peptidylprolyl isomerase [Ruegeria sp. HKCCD4332]NOD87507.1 peptidylprolyl isomerase [Ruegeria sp. HKCCD4318]NOE13062.1 peptidylprolyl isomerase [Ruegeria sp. HKCCD4318-2]NOG08770.1 peptidylprolyl isomerase [Ruegeria sp. HKCCD4315]
MAAGAKSLSKTFVWILMGLLMLGLAGFGATNLSGTVRTVAQVGDESISVDEYVRELQREIRAVEAQTGQPMQMSQARDLGLDQNALARLTALAALDNEVGQLGISIGDENLQQEIVAIPAFQGVDGSFDREAYRFQLEQIGMTDSEFETDLRKESARTIVQGAIMGGVEMPATLTDTMTDYIGARRSFTVATVGTEALENPIAEPTDAQIQTYYDENGDLFTLPRTKQLTYAILSPAMLIDTVEVDQDALQKLYEDRSDEYNQPERRLVERLNFPDEQAASEAKAQLEVGGTTFEQLVRERDLELNDIDLGDVTREDLGEAADAVFAADLDTVVGPLPSVFGPALFRINGSLAANNVPFEEAEPALREELAAERARRLIEAQSEDINDMLAGGATLEELADETEMELGQIDWTRESSDEIAAYDGFRVAAEAVQEGDFPEIAFLEDGSIFALRLNEVLPRRPEPLDSARDRVAAAWLQAETNKALEDRANAVLTQLATDGDFTTTGLPFRVENALTRTAFLDDVPADFMNEVFQMEPGELRVIGGNGAALLVRLDEVLPPADTDELRQLREALSAQMNQALSQNIFNAYVRDAQTRARPVVDQQALNAVQSSF